MMAYELVSKLVAAAVVASREASQIIRDVKFSGELDIKEKGEKTTDYVTKADIESQKCIIAHLKTLFPGVQYRGEEGKLDNYEAKIDPRIDNEVMTIISGEQVNFKNNRPDFVKITENDLFVWIDPLDGTREYVMDDEKLLEEVTVLIGIAYKGRPIAGVINQPFYQRLCPNNYRSSIVWAIVGLGVYHDRLRNVESSKFLKYQASTQTGHKNRIVTSRAHATEIIKESLNTIPNSETIYRGGCGFKVITLLDNEADCYLYPSRGLKRWDTCAPEAVIRALLGECTDIFNERYDYSNIDESSYENLLGLVAAFSNHEFYIKHLTTDIIGHVWTESLKPKRQKKK